MGLLAELELLPGSAAVVMHAAAVANAATIAAILLPERALLVGTDVT